MRLAMLLLLAGCPRPIPDPVPPSSAPFCAPTVKAEMDHLCANSFTKSGYACVQCEAGGCIERTVMVFCVANCLDPRCKPAQ
jgi:hypothetical protein